MGSLFFYQRDLLQFIGVESPIWASLGNLYCVIESFSGWGIRNLSKNQAMRAKKGGALLFFVLGARTIARGCRSAAKRPRTIAWGVAALQSGPAPLHCHVAVM